MPVPSFQVIPQRNHSFTVKLTMTDGRSRIMPGFSSEHEAAAWVIQAERMLQEADPRSRVAPRDKARH